MQRIRPITRRHLVGTAAGLAATIALGTAPPLTTWSHRRQTPGADPGGLAVAATDAYVFAYPLVLMDITRQQMTAVPAGNPAVLRAPVNQFAHMPAFPDHTFTAVVSPNVDTLYSVAWLDLGPEPVVLDVPDTEGRYYLMPMFDAWTNVFASPGTRTTGSGAGAFAIVGPNWTDALPDTLEAITSPTEMVWIVGRTQANGPADYENVHALQRQYTLTPLSAWGQSYLPPTEVPVDPDADAETAPVDQVAGMTAEAFWTRFAAVMMANPPAEADAPMVDQLAGLGIEPGQALAWNDLAPDIVTALETGTVEGLRMVQEAGLAPPAEVINTWGFPQGLGSYGTDYMQRAAIANMGLGANLREDAIAGIARVDSDGQPLHGANRYVLHLEPEEIPPVNAFWSVTMYDDRQFLVENPIDRFAIRDRDEQLVFGPDGSLDIYMQHESPGAAQESNWLPAPADAFNLVMRLYWPKPEALDLTWAPSAIRKVKE